ncbi:MAG: hydroxyquinol 1,2-dioxygenase [Pseudonocardia sp.]|uniref:dioxygenase family protein n=1 Tax=unclassified Pseudonocardia TaxID=2619320 RepID=UPI00086D8FE9|nr:MULTISPECIES: dioxygenase [unclassified Pseudonocardia]MBN9107140.1 hydroxyquinol 1,2-dioxygenase [Pseudonocardia sp.]ODU26374.1 MAG: hydroxyquinol 1,2-dioxygenase [Pseudonocardia sp. SCN 72-51]ODV02709.1 MAG: hydroxyquinol 1,2-dioxygenase [Pseudonocardia sp. SCN 73-27]
MLDLDDTTITTAVLDAIADTADPRLREIMSAVVRHAHDLVREVGLREEEWAAAVDFLTRTGQLCSPRRQEFILLSDVLGITMLVDALQNRRTFGGSENSVLGPFFREDRPEFASGADLAPDRSGIRLQVRGQVVNHRGVPVAGARVDVWHSDADGHYDSDIPGIEGSAMRGLLVTDVDGVFTFRSVAPGAYPIPGDGTVGELMRGLERPLMRPAHIHVRIVADGFAPVTTMLFRDDDPHLDADPVFGTKKSLLARFVPTVDDEGEFERVEHRFVLEPVTTDSGEGDGRR